MSLISTGGEPLDPALRWTATRLGDIKSLVEPLDGPAEARMQQLVGVSWHDLVSVAYRPLILRAVRDALASRRPLDVHCRLKLDGSGERWYRTRVIALRDDRGRVTGWRGRSEDIHAQKLTEEALYENAAQIKAVFDQGPVGILHRDLGKRILMVNDRFCALVGHTAAELDGLSPDAFVHPDDLAGAKALMAEKMATAEPFDMEIRFVRPDDSTVWCSLHTSFVVDDKGHAKSVIMIARDISARRAAEAALRASEEHHRYTVQFNPGLPWTAAPDGSINEVSPRWEEVTGQAPEAAMGNGWVRRLHPDDVAPTVAVWRSALTSGEPVDLEYRLAGRDGGYRWFRVRAQPRRDEAGHIVRWYGTLESIDDRKAAENALRENEQRFRLAVRAAELGVWDCDPPADRLIWSLELKVIFGISAVEKPNSATVLRLIHPDDRHLLQAMLDTTSQGQGQQDFEATLRIRRDDDGRERWVRSSGWKTFDASGKAARVLVTFHDITDERTADERIRWMSTHDPMTRLPNRAAFQHELERRISRAGRPSSPSLAVIVADVDHLKETNDRMGHDAGDALLCTLTDRLREALPAGAFIARLGGDEFGIILQLDPTVHAEALATQIAARLRAPFSYAGGILDCRASLGMAYHPDHGDDAADLLKAADTALHTAKAIGRGTVTLFHPDLRREARQRSEMLVRARSAIDEDRIRPFYQPKIDLRSGRVAGFEALLRWHDGDGRMMPPAGIAAAFGNMELAADIHDRMLAHLLADIRRWRDTGLDFGRIAMNVADAQFARDDFAERFLSALAAEGLATRYIELEVTETVFLGHGAEGVGRALRKLSDEGIRIALDDFGTGFASLTHLKTFPVDVIKIDRSFMADLDNPVGNSVIVEALVALARRLGMETVAEGVEDIGQLDFLRRCGCDLGQGFLFSKAIAPDHVPEVIRSATTHLGDLWPS